MLKSFASFAAIAVSLALCQGCVTRGLGRAGQNAPAEAKTETAAAPQTVTATAALSPSSLPR